MHIHVAPSHTHSPFHCSLDLVMQLEHLHVMSRFSPCQHRNECCPDLHSKRLATCPSLSPGCEPAFLCCWETASGVKLLLLQLVQPSPGVGTSGQIARIKLENFMCHDHLEMDFTYAANCYFVLLGTAFLCTGLHSLVLSSLHWECCIVPLQAKHLSMKSSQKLFRRKCLSRWFHFM